MALSRLLVQQFRNLHAIDFHPSPGVNLIFGENGSGKTSLLEAINVLALGRSFRSHKHKALINHQADCFTVFGRVASEVADIPLGIQRWQNGDLQLKVQNQPIDSVASLAQYLPVQVINAETFQLLDGSPKERRQFIDWLVFHVEHQFFPAWKAAQRCLKHRNSLLRRDRIDPFELTTWDQELVHLARQLDELRGRVLELFTQRFNSFSREFLALEGLSLGYYRGWNPDKDFAEVLTESRDRDRRIGSTQLGPHRADLRILLGTRNAAEVLSRGQQKLLVCALKITQGLVYSEMTGRKTVYLVDDLPAELDQAHRQLLVDWLHQMQTQVFITGVDADVLREPWETKADLQLKMFHVEQGKLTAY